MIFVTLRYLCFGVNVTCDFLLVLVTSHYLVVVDAEEDGGVVLSNLEILSCTARVDMGVILSNIQFYSCTTVHCTI